MLKHKWLIWAVLILVYGLIALWGVRVAGKTQAIATYPEFEAETALINDFSPLVGETDIPALIRLKSQEWGVSTGVALRVAGCESNFQQFNPDGSVLHGREHWPDTGIFQINLDRADTDWRDVAQMTGYDPYTIEGNIDLAFWIVKHGGGWKHWVCF